MILVGVFGVLRSFQRYFLVTTTKKPKQIYDAHFVRLPANALPHDDPISSKTLVAWVWRHYFSSKERAFFSYDPPHNTELQQAKFSSNGQKTFLPYLSKLDALRVIFWTLRNFILSLKDTLKGNWFSLFLLHEAIDYKIFEIAKVRIWHVHIGLATSIVRDDHFGPIQLKKGKPKSLFLFNQSQRCPTNRQKAIFCEMVSHS